MRNLSEKHPVQTALLLLLVICLLRVVDVFVLRSDELLGEQFLTKIVGLILIVVYTWNVKGNLRSIGLHAKAWQFSVCMGLLIMAAGLVLGYVAEGLYLAISGAQPRLFLEAQGNTLIPEDVATGGLIFGVVLVVGNVINSFMEEGLFRGVLITHLGSRTSLLKANLIQALVFGVWHIVWPIRDYMDGKTDFTAALVTSVGYIILSGLIGFAFGYLYQKTDSLWAPWAAHTLNNTILNLLHFTTPGGIPPTMPLRVGISTLTVALLLLVVKNVTAKRGMEGLRAWVQ